MNKRYILVSCLISILIIFLYIINLKYDDRYDKALMAYQVYLDGQELGLIKNRTDLYALIDEEQQEIKNKYKVSTVYPPNGLNIVEVNTYNDNYLNVEDIYQKIENSENFTVKGYIVTIKPKDKENIIINVLDKNIFIESIKKFVLSFITEAEFNNYVNGGSRTITDIGQVIENMYFDEAITIKEGYINAQDEIFIDSTSLTQYLLFGKDAQMDSYTIKLGDSIDSISEAYKLNPQEFIIANPNYRGINTLLKVGESVNVTLINPIISFSYDVYKIDETETPYGTTKTTDSSKDENYKEVVKPGVTGLTLNHERYKVTNGEQSSEIKIVDSIEIRKMQNEEIVIGKPKVYYQPVTGSYVDIPGDWGWPTNQPSVITSRFYYRWGKMHEGIDISGTGYGSNIYAIADGTVAHVATACKSCAQWSNGTYVYVEHAGGYYSAYLHLKEYIVNVGDHVSKGQVIGHMGNSGYATGTHLHLALFNGYPSNKGNAIDPLKTIYKGIK